MSSTYSKASSFHSPFNLAATANTTSYNNITIVIFGLRLALRIFHSNFFWIIVHTVSILLVPKKSSCYSPLDIGWYWCWHWYFSNHDGEWNLLIIFNFHRWCSRTSCEAFSGRSDNKGGKDVLWEFDFIQVILSKRLPRQSNVNFCHALMITGPVSL